MYEKSIDTLVEDIYDLFTRPHEVNQENLDKFKEDVGAIIKESLEQAGVPRKFELRMSNIGTKERKLWFDSRTETVGVPKPNEYIKFMFGHIIEALVLFLTREAGHVVEEEQKEVELNGVIGHKDCVIDGCLADVKSASSFSFSKYTGGSFLVSDTFGYSYQLSGYFEADPKDNDEVFWIFVDKQHGDISLVRYHAFELPSASERIAEVQTALASDSPPPRCYEPENDKYGNVVVPKLCQYCPHLTNKNNCWNSPRVFYFSTGPKFYLEVNNPPRVTEITERFFRDEITEQLFRD